MKIKEILKCFLRQFDAENTVDYICGTEALPLPLSPEEESAMLGKLEHGEETDKVKAELIQHNLRLVVYIARSSTIRAWTRRPRFGGDDRADQGDQFL